VWSSTGHTYKWNDFSSAKLNQSITRPNQVYTQPTSGNLTVEYLTFLTNKLHVIDVDDLDEWNKYCPLDFSKAPQWKSRNKRLPHYVVCIKNDTGKQRQAVTHPETKQVIADIMTGQNIWVRTDEQMLNPCGAIEVFDLPSKPKHQLLKVPIRIVKKQK